MKKIIFLIILSICAQGSFAQNISYHDVLGKTFISSAGSGMGSFFMSVSIKVEGRNTVSVGFVEGTIFWHSPDITAIEDNSKPTHINYVMINCKNKTYSTYPDPESENAQTLREFSSGAKYKWGNYKEQSLITGVSAQEQESITNYFDTVCRYTEQ